MKVCKAAFTKEFIQMANDGWLQGWHERNGGNLSYRMTEDDVKLVCDHLKQGKWQPLGIEAPGVAGEYLLITAAGSYFKDIISKPKECMGIVQIDKQGKRFRCCWGFKGGGKPTSELPSHIMNQEARKLATNGENRVIYHSHPANVIAMTFAVPLDSESFTRELWAMISECAIVFPDGVGVIDWMVPGSLDIGRASAHAMEKYEAVIWPYHGIFSAGKTFSEAFGLLHTVEKAAEVYVKAHSMGEMRAKLNPGIRNLELKSLSDAYSLQLQTWD